MKKTLIVSLCVVFAMTSLAAVSFAKNVPGKRLADANFESTPMQSAGLPADLQQLARPNLSTAAADTFHLAWYSYDAGPSPDPMGCVRIDLTSQIDTFFHVADASELNGGTFGNLIVLGSFGTQSIWCGVFGPTALPPYCGYS
ncbi:MAG: hypothetical protein IH900_02420, partial [Proteobacteria bacterium]|nr:hypothetical protein [Pseudomonadota bacterium]